MEPFISFLTNEAEINQAKVKIGSKKIEAFGALDDSAFREKLQEMSTALLHIDDSIDDADASFQLLCVLRNSTWPIA